MMKETTTTTTLGSLALKTHVGFKRKKCNTMPVPSRKKKRMLQHIQRDDDDVVQRLSVSPARKDVLSKRKRLRRRRSSNDENGKPVAAQKEHSAATKRKVIKKVKMALPARNRTRSSNENDGARLFKMTATNTIKYDDTKTVAVCTNQKTSRREFFRKLVPLFKHVKQVTVSAMHTMTNKQLAGLFCTFYSSASATTIQRFEHLLFALHPSSSSPHTSIRDDIRLCSVVLSLLSINGLKRYWNCFCTFQHKKYDTSRDVLLTHISWLQFKKLLFTPSQQKTAAVVTCASSGHSNAITTCIGLPSQKSPMHPLTRYILRHLQTTVLWKSFPWKLFEAEYLRTDTCSVYALTCLYLMSNDAIAVLRSLFRYHFQARAIYNNNNNHNTSSSASSSVLLPALLLNCITTTTIGTTNFRCDQYNALIEHIATLHHNQHFVAVEDGSVHVLITNNNNTNNNTTPVTRMSHRYYCFILFLDTFIRDQLYKISTMSSPSAAVVVDQLVAFAERTRRHCLNVLFTCTLCCVPRFMSVLEQYCRSCPHTHTTSTGSSSHVPGTDPDMMFRELHSHLYADMLDLYSSSTCTPCSEEATRLVNVAAVLSTTVLTTTLHALYKTQQQQPQHINNTLTTAHTDTHICLYDLICTPHTHPTISMMSFPLVILVHQRIQRTSKADISAFINKNRAMLMRYIQSIGKLSRTYDLLGGRITLFTGSLCKLLDHVDGLALFVEAITSEVKGCTTTTTHIKLNVNQDNKNTIVNDNNISVLPVLTALPVRRSVQMQMSYHRSATTTTTTFPSSSAASFISSQQHPPPPTLLSSSLPSCAGSTSLALASFWLFACHKSQAPPQYHTDMFVCSDSYCCAWS